MSLLLVSLLLVVVLAGAWLVSRSRAPAPKVAAPATRPLRVPVPLAPLAAPPAAAPAQPEPQ